MDHYQTIVKIMETGNVADVIYLDIAKAFDKVDHGILLRKLRVMGIGGPMLTWIQEFLVNRSQIVSVDGELSQKAAVVSGVPQGTVLGPILFLVFVSDVDGGLQHASASSFADDTRILMKIETNSDTQNLQNDLNTVYKWAENNNMAFNCSKFQHMRCGSPVVDASHYVSPSGDEIAMFGDIRDLGIMMSDSCKFHEHIDKGSSKGKRMSGWILRTFKTRDRGPMLTLYKSLVLPILDYCCQLWSPDQLGLVRKLEAIQRHFTSKINGCGGLSYWERLSELRLYSLERRRDRYAIIYVWKVINNLAPNFMNEDYMIKTKCTPRHGRKCVIPALVRGTAARIVTLKENSFALRGPRMFNCIPAELRNCDGTVESFKNNLDKFLAGVPDKPCLPLYYQASTGNSLLQQVMQQRVASLQLLM